MFCRFNFPHPPSNCTMLAERPDPELDMMEMRQQRAEIITADHDALNVDCTTATLDDIL